MATACPVVIPICVEKRFTISCHVNPKWGISPASIPVQLARSRRPVRKGRRSGPEGGGGSGEAEALARGRVLAISTARLAQDPEVGEGEEGGEGGIDAGVAGDDTLQTGVERRGKVDTSVGTFASWASDGIMED